ncbi:MAG TPA: hypothetical protein VKN18_16665 [Blastocatellia bacterium]|nr:hypothetical protein [Blastocatellia bacterium]
MIGQERLPRGSAYSLDMILMLAQKIQVTDELEDAKQKAENIVELAGELIDRYNRQMRVAA